MKRYTKTLLTVTSMMLLNGCGGGGGSGVDSLAENESLMNEINSYDVIFVYSGLPPEACVDIFSMTDLDNTNIESSMSESVPNGTTCTTFGRDGEDDHTCLEYAYDYGNTTCVYAFNQINETTDQEAQSAIMNEEFKSYLLK